MSTVEKNGLDNHSVTPATFGGRGWHQRVLSLAEELAQGSLWRRCGTDSEVKRLREVVLSWPSDSLDFTGTPDQYLMLAKPDLSLIRRQAEQLAKAYTEQGVTVHLWKGEVSPPPNFIFMRDLFWATPQGIVLARPAALQRAGEECWAAQALVSIGVPIVLHPYGHATFEGADALWLDEHTVLLGTGVRSNQEAARQITRFLADAGIDTIEIPLPKGVQHLLGIVNFIDRDLAALNQAKASGELRRILQERSITLLELPPDEELLQGRGMNFVTLEPRRVLMPAQCPGIRSKLARARVEAIEVEVSEYLKAAGGPGCLTGILLRG